MNVQLDWLRILLPYHSRITRHRVHHKVSKVRSNTWSACFLKKYPSQARAFIVIVCSTYSCQRALLDFYYFLYTASKFVLDIRPATTISIFTWVRYLWIIPQVSFFRLCHACWSAQLPLGRPYSQWLQEKTNITGQMWQCASCAGRRVDR